MPHQVPDTPYVYFTGNRIFLNRLAGVEKDCGATSAALSSTLFTPRIAHHSSGGANSFGVLERCKRLCSQAMAPITAS